MKEYEDRKYQVDAEDSLLADVIQDRTCNPVAAMPTGSGKTKVLSSFIYKYLEEHMSDNILVISHTENILLQDYEAICNFFPGLPIGLYSAGLKSKNLFKITIAGIQSIYRKGAMFKDFGFNIAIIDECHTVPTKGNGMYKQFFDTCPVQRIGLTGTHFRTGHGFLHIGEDAMFNKLSVDLCSSESFNQLVEDGYLTNLYSKPAELQLDTKGVKTTADDFNQKDLADRFDRTGITNAAVKELVKFGENYHSWLVFAIDIDHAEHITGTLQGSGINAESLHSRKEVDRHEMTDRFKSGELRCIVSVGMVTTGFDAPNIDLIVLLRPTKSPVLHVQMIGRGSRTFEGKSHCLVLDFAGNIRRLGPINHVRVPGRKKEGVGGEPIVKMCPFCGCYHHPTVKVCDVCGHIFEFRQSLETKADNQEVIKTGKRTNTEWVDVTNVTYYIHEKPGKPDSLRVKYNCGLFSLSEYICRDHEGYAKHKAVHWINYRWKESGLAPDTVEGLFDNRNRLYEPDSILIDTFQKYPTIIDAKFTLN